MLFRPASFTQQPQYAPPLNRNSSLTRGIQFLILPSVGGGAPVDLAAGNAVSWSTVGSGGNPRGTVGGSGWNIATATTDAVQATVSGLSFPFSMGVVMVPNAGAAGNWIASACNSTVANTNSRVGLKMDFLGDVSASSSNATGTSTADNTSNKITVGEPQFIAGTFASVTSRKSFLNGRAGSGSTGSNIPASIDTLCVGSGAASGTRASAQTGAYQLFVYWNRALSDAEAIEFTRNPWQIFEQRPQVGWFDAVAGAPGDVSAALTGSAATTSAGTAKSAIDYAATGQQATASAGTTTSAIAQALTGQAATASQGTLTSSVSVVLTGQAATFAQGNVTTGTDVTAALTGQAATGQAGTLGSAITQALSGQAATSAQGTLTASQTSDVTVALSGQGLTVSQGDIGKSGYDLAVAAGRGNRVAVELHGQIHYFEDEEEARKWLAEQFPKLEQKVKKAAKRIAREVVKNALQPEPFKPMLVVEGPPEVQAVARMRLAMLETTFRKTLDAQIKRLEDEEEEVVALLLM